MYTNQSTFEGSRSVWYLAAGLAVDHGVSGVTLAALQVSEGLHGPPGLQVARHAHRRSHL